MTQKGTLPLTGQINTEFNEAQWSMLSKGLINDFPMEAIISFPDQASVGRKKIKLIIDLAFKPGQFTPISITGESISNVVSKKTADGLSRSLDYFIDKIIAPNSWVLIGKLQGDNPVPIVILFNPILNLGTYSFKKEEESMKSFNPQNN